MTPEQRQEEISKAYVQAVAAACGFAVTHWSQDHGSIDVTIGAASTVGNGKLAKPKIDVQLKATTQQQRLREKFVSWRLDIAHYDALRSPSATPHLLVVLVLPKLADESIIHSPKQLLIRQCAYWVNMTGMDLAIADGSKSVTVRLPREQIFSPDALRSILSKVSEGKPHEV